jgi:outer membrane putative beta-barrel porin/alpha-amylase
MRSPASRALATLGLATLVVASAACADDGIATDRPDFTETATPVERGQVQLEGGATLSRFDRSLGELLARIGITRGLELRLALNSYVWTRGDADAPSGFEDLSVGAKIGLRPADEPGSLLPAIAIIAETTAPTGKSALRETRWEPGAKLCLAWDLTEQMALGSNLNLALVEDAAGERVGEWSSSLSLGRSLSESVGAFLETFGSARISGESDATTFVNTGLTLGLGPDAQLDARVGTQVGSSERDWFVGVGAARRW